MEAVDEAPAIPLWINGHAYLTLTIDFHEVRNPRTGEVLRRTPLCDARAAQQAVAAAQAALPAWAALAPGARAALLDALAAALAGYATHFSALLREETGAPAAAAAEIAQSVALLRGEAGAGLAGESPGVAQAVGIVGTAAAPLHGALRLAVPVLRAGGVVIVKPDPATPSAPYALAELTARCGFPGGVFNVVHGAEAAVAGLREAGLRMLFA